MQSSLGLLQAITDEGDHNLPVFVEIVLLAESGLGLLILMGEIGLEARAEIDVPAPEPAEGRFGILVVMSPELAGFAGILCHSRID